jgi:hypothetical protein
MDLEAKITSAVVAVLFLGAILRIELGALRLRRLRARVHVDRLNAR